MKSYIKKLLNESMSNRVLMEKFIDFVVDYLSLSKNFKVRLTTDKIDQDDPRDMSVGSAGPPSSRLF